MLSRKTCGTRNKLCSGTWNNIVNKVQTLFQRDLVNKTRTEQSLKNWKKDDFGHKLNGGEAVIWRWRVDGYCGQDVGVAYPRGTVYEM